MIRAFVQTRRVNYEFLRAAGESVGREYEAKCYDELRRPAEELSTTRIIDGVEVFFSAEAYEVKPNGDVCFCVDVDARLPTLLGVKPSYQFVKRRDGSVYY